MRLLLGISLLFLGACGPGVRLLPDSANKAVARNSAKTQADHGKSPAKTAPDEASKDPKEEPLQKPDSQNSPDLDSDKEVTAPPVDPNTAIPPEFDSQPAAPSAVFGGVTEPDAKEILENGRLIPTIYYSPIYNEDQPRCTGEAMVSMKDMSGKVLIDVCAKTQASCALQGSCVIRKNKTQKVYNVIDRKAGEDRFAIVSDRCPYGYGVHDPKNRRSFCLQPFVSIAADLDIYRPGDVIFVPQAKGLALPSGRKHTGYFIVADAGRAIKGKGRFDFFSGHQNWTEASNPLSKIGLNNKDSNLDYRRVEGLQAEKFRKSLRGLISY